jgi:hypothetical protein
VTEDRIAAALGGQEVIDILRHPDKVEGVLLESSGKVVLRNPADYRPRSDAVTMSPNVAANLVQVMTTEHRQYSGAKGCMPTYGVRLRFAKGDRQSDIYLCFECAILQVVLDGETVGGMGFDLIWSEIISDVRRIFPDDEGLRELEQNRGRNGS